MRRVWVWAALAAGAAGWLAAAGYLSDRRGASSDVVRQWVVCQYVNAGQNPYPLARRILADRYGEGNPTRAAVFRVPADPPPPLADEVRPAVGPPEATYPPPAVALLAVTVGPVPDSTTVRLLWLAVNAAAAVWVAWRLARYRAGATGGTPADHLPTAAAALMLFSAAHNCLEVGQFSLLVLGLLLVAADPSSAGPWVRGLALGLALAKPSIALPFVWLPAVRREWRVLLAAAGVQAAGFAYVTARTGADPLALTADWLAVSRYFLQGVYTVQDYLNLVARLVGRDPGPLAAVALLLLAGAAAWVGRHRDWTRQFDLLAVTAVFWTYHGPYDFVLLLPVLLRGLANPSFAARAATAAAFAVLTVGLLDPVIQRDGPGFWAARWAARLTVLGLYLREHVLLVRDVRRPGGAG